MKATITNNLIPKLRPANKPYDVRDDKLTGFLIRVNVSGKMIYMCEYARAKRVTIGKVNVLTPMQARDRAKEIIADYVRGIGPNKSVNKSNKILTLKDFLENEYGPWFIASGRSPKSLDNLKNFKQSFGDKNVNELTHILVEKWQIKRLQEVKPATVNRNINALKAAITKLIEWEFIAENPLKKLKRLKIDQSAKVRYLSLEEENRLRRALRMRDKRIKQNRHSSNLWRQERNYTLLPNLTCLQYVDYLEPMVLISINTGMRRGELFRITWDNVDFTSKVLTVDGGSAKSRNTRHIPMNKEVLRVLKSWQQQTDKQGLVFKNTKGEKFTDVKKAWRTLLEKAEIKNFRWHDMRHHFASMLVMAEVDLNTVRELLGHSDTKMTLRYAHLAPEHKAKAVEKLLNMNF